MPHKNCLLTRTLFFLTIMLGVVFESKGQELPIYEIPSPSIGSPYHGVTFDQQGNLYTSTTYYSNQNAGSVIELIPVGSTWNLSTLYTFQGNPYTEPSGVILDTMGNVYGTTVEGGAYNSGNVFMLTPNQGGGWTYSSLHDFNPSKGDGANPYSALLLVKGHLYGTTCCNGKGAGTVFELSRTKSGSWKERILYNFPGYAGDGFVPLGGLISDAKGNLYGTTIWGGTKTCVEDSRGCGTVFMLSHAKGGWKESVLYSFAGGANDGLRPNSTLVMDSSGNLYGTTIWGGNQSCAVPGDPPGCGILFALNKSNQSWSEVVLHAFAGGSADGAISGNVLEGALAIDAKGNLFGTTPFGGNQSCQGGTYSPNGCGTVFSWRPNTFPTYIILYSFLGLPADGAVPYSGLTFYGGNLYGTTAVGGVYDLGTVFIVYP